MVKEAQANEAADKKRRESVDAKNQADTLIYQAEKTVKDMEGKGHDDKIKKVQEAINTLKETMKGDDVDKIKADTEASRNRSMNCLLNFINRTSKMARTVALPVLMPVLAPGLPLTIRRTMMTS